MQGRNLDERMLENLVDQLDVHVTLVPCVRVRPKVPVVAHCVLGIQTAVSRGHVPLVSEQLVSTA